MSLARWTPITLAFVLGAAAQPENDAAPPAPLPRPANTPITPVDATPPDAPAAIYPEGTFFSRQEGRLHPASTGDTLFIPERGPDAPAAPLVLLPSQTLDRLEQALGSEWRNGAGERRAVVSGQAYVYRDTLYLMPTAFSLAPRVEPPAETPPPRTDAAADARVQDIIRDLERRRAIPRALDPSEPRSAQPPVLAAPEGSQVLSRRGRIVPMRGGGWLFTPDSGTANGGDAPLIMLPCRQLEVVERLSPGRTGNTAFRVSGRIYSYRGRGFILPTLVQTMTSGDLLPTQ